MNFNILIAKNKEFSLHNQVFKNTYFCISAEEKHLIEKIQINLGSC